MPRIIDVIDHVNVADDELVWREPQDREGDFRFGSQLIVNESQAAVFVRAGQALDVFGPGRHTLSTANLPILSSIVGLATSGRTPFTAYVYFINLRDMPQVGWGTSKPLYLRTNTGLGITLLRTHGVMDISIADPMMFLKKYGVNRALTTMRDIKDRIQTMLLGEVNNLLNKSGAQDLMEANGILEEIEGALLVKVNEKFAEIGMKIRAFEANPFDTVTLPIEELRDIVPLEIWKDVLETQKRLDIGMAAASNTGGNNFASAGLGLGLGQQLAGQMNPSGQSSEVSALQQQMLQQQQMMSQMMNQMMMNQMNQNPQAPATTPEPTTPSSNPQTKEEIQLLIDNLDAKLMTGEISEATYQKLVDKWQTRLDSMG
ncbi:MAG: SPFH domain-containing protein [Phototrophicales bacterium]|nr:SPFH domain-containing protein [Phototrophicales bacterium]